MKKASKILFLVSFLFMFMGTVAIVSSATAEKVPLANVTLKNPIKYDKFSDLVAGVTETAVSVLMPFVVIAFIYSGFLYVKAQGKAKELEEAHKAILWSVVGAFILFGAYAFAQIISTTVGTITNI